MLIRHGRRTSRGCRGVVGACAFALTVAVWSWFSIAVGQDAAPETPPAATAEDGSEGSGDAIQLNFEGADIREVIYTFGAALGINYWIDPRVQGQVTARSFGPIYVDDLLPVFHRILRSNGFTAVREGDLYMIVPAEEGKTRAPLSEEGTAEKPQERFVVELVRVRHVDAEQIVNLLNPFVSPGGDVTAVGRSNLVVISDVASNAARLRELVDTFDTDTFADMTGKVYPIHYASVEDIAQELTTILEGYQVTESGARAHIIPLVRLNSLAVVAFDPAVQANVEHWLNILDAQAEGGTERRVYVYRVENSKAVDLAEVLNEVYAGLAEDNAGGARARGGALSERGVGLAGGLDNAQRGRAGRGNQPERAANRAATRGQLVLRGTGEGTAGGAAFEQEVKIVADESTNALVVLATPRDYEMIRSVIRELDVVPRQVLVEMLIAEITLTDKFSTGVEHQLGAASSEEPKVDGKLPGMFFGTHTLRADGKLGSGGIDNLKLSWFGGDYTATLTALADRSKVKVLSRPHILTTDNQEARIVVGQEVPILTSQSDTSVNNEGGASAILQNVEYRDTGVVVHVTPQVNSEGLVNMNLSQEVSEIAGSVSGIASPTFTTREAETTVVVQSGETIVIGGIISETNRRSQSGVPFLMDVPFLGELFRSTGDDQERTELIVLITPYVVRNRTEARSVTSDFRARVDDVLRELKIEDGANQATHTVVLQRSAD